MDVPASDLDDRRAIRRPTTWPTHRGNAGQASLCWVADSIAPSLTLLADDITDFRRPHR